MQENTSIQKAFLPHSTTGFFSNLITDYLKQKDKLRSFYHFSPDDQGLERAISMRKKMPINREVLTEVIIEQYKRMPQSEKVSKNINLLNSDDTFTVCTAHQPNLLTGYAYFFYKIMHVVKLSSHLKLKFPQYNFVPVYYMGSEDNDLEELGTFRMNDISFRWKTQQTGAVGRMNTADLKELLADFYKVVGPPNENAEKLISIVKDAYEDSATIAEATHKMVHFFTQQYGVIVVNPDDKRLKKEFVPILKNELLQPVAHEIVKKQSALLGEHYKVQAHVRPINIFYLRDNIRERIEYNQGVWQVLHTNIHWDSAESLVEELEQYPERFSPNVILRGLFQESILPNVAFVGGGSEVAYWLQLQTLFNHYNIFYPTIILRQSVQWLDKYTCNWIIKMNYQLADLFKPTETLIMEYANHHSEHDLDLKEETLALNRLLDQIKLKAQQIDKSLLASARAVATKVNYQIGILEKKMLRSEKKKMSIQLSRIYQLKRHTFPKGGLQERYESFLPFYIAYGNDFFELLQQHILPFGNQFLIFYDKNSNL